MPSIVPRCLLHVLTHAMSRHHSNEKGLICLELTRLGDAFMSLLTVWCPTYKWTRLHNHVYLLRAERHDAEKGGENVNPGIGCPCYTIHDVTSCLVHTFSSHQVADFLRRDLGHNLSSGGPGESKRFPLSRRPTRRFSCEERSLSSHDVRGAPLHRLALTPC